MEKKLEKRWLLLRLNGTPLSVHFKTKIYVYKWFLNKILLVLMWCLLITINTLTATNWWIKHIGIILLSFLSGPWAILQHWLWLIGDWLSRRWHWTHVCWCLCSQQNWSEYNGIRVCDMTFSIFVYLGIMLLWRVFPISSCIS